MKHSTEIVALLLLIVLTVCVNFGCDRKIEQSAEESEEKQTRELTDIDAESYRDYAEEVYLNTQTFPELERQGFFIAKGYQEGRYAFVEEEKVTEESLEKYFDPEKNIVIVINGMQNGCGRYRNDYMSASSLSQERRAHANDGEYLENQGTYFAKEDADREYDITKFWFDNGYNVLYFHWEMFVDYYGDGSVFDTVQSPLVAQTQVWSADKGVYATFTREGKVCSTAPENAVNGSVAEWFVAEYIRMGKALGALFPSYRNAGKDIRVLAHSMGGVLGTAGTALLKLVAEQGQTDMNLTPNRLCLLDAYAVDMGKATLAWTGQPYPADGCMITCARVLRNVFDVAVEYYLLEGYLVPFLNVEGLMNLTYSREEGKFVGFNCECANAFLELCPMVLIRSYFAGVSATAMAMDGHCPMREWYFVSLLYDAPTTSDGKTVPTARMSDEDIKKNAGTFFEMQSERTYACESVRCDDDTFK